MGVGGILIVDKLANLGFNVSQNCPLLKFPHPLMPLASFTTRHTQPLKPLLFHQILLLKSSFPPRLRVHFPSTNILINRLYSTNSRSSWKSFSPIQILKLARMGGHHHHEHEHDTALLTSKDTSNPGVRIARIGLYPLVHFS